MEKIRVWDKHPGSATLISPDPHDWSQAEMGFATVIPTPELLGFTRTIENKVYKVSRQIRAFF
jgi:hypothetical protein